MDDAAAVERIGEGALVMIVDEILAEAVGWTDCGISKQRSPTVAQLAEEFDLSPDPGTYHEIDATEAKQVTQFVLQYDLAYGGQVMAPARAAELAERFLSHFGTADTRYYTNGALHRQKSGAGWNPATASTFDTGILVIGPLCAGFLWVEQED